MSSFCSCDGYAPLVFQNSCMIALCSSLCILHPKPGTDFVCCGAPTGAGAGAAAAAVAAAAAGASFFCFFGGGVLGSSVSHNRVIGFNLESKSKSLRCFLFIFTSASASNPNFAAIITGVSSSFEKYRSPSAVFVATPIATPYPATRFFSSYVSPAASRPLMRFDFGFGFGSVGRSRVGGGGAIESSIAADIFHHRVSPPPPPPPRGYRRSSREVHSTSNVPSKRSASSVLGESPASSSSSPPPSTRAASGAASRTAVSSSRGVVGRSDEGASSSRTNWSLSSSLLAPTPSSSRSPSSPSRVGASASATARCDCVDAGSSCVGMIAESSSESDPPSGSMTAARVPRASETDMWGKTCGRAHRDRDRARAGLRPDYQTADTGREEAVRRGRRRAATRTRQRARRSFGRVRDGAASARARLRALTRPRRGAGRRHRDGGRTRERRRRRISALRGPGGNLKAASDGMGEEETPPAAEPEATEPAAEPAPEAEPAAEDAAPETPAPAADADAAAGADADAGAGAGAGAGDDADAASAAPPTAPDSPAPVTTGDGTPAEVGTPADAATTDADTPADGATPADGSPSKDANTDADDESDGDGDGDEEGSPAKDSEGGGVGDGDGDDDDGGDADGERANGADGGRDADGTQSDDSDAELADFYRRDGAAAHDIEGFNDDFVAQGQSDSDEDEYAAEMVKLAKETEVALASLESEKKGGQGKKDDGPDEGELLEEEIRRVQDEVFKLDRVNSELEKKAAQVVKRAPGAAGSGASASASGGASDAGSDAGPGKKKPAGAKPAGDDPRSDQKTEQRYHAALTRWESSRDELNRVEAHYDDAIARAEAYLEARETRARDVRDAFAAFKLEARSSSHWFPYDRVGAARADP
ncbi:uncharacterized protein MICPUCDRAFT_43013 [Micromonas pusilla CCMP1545]|uniref:Predicted protein n=1 Tax=Micromonas pusilla (strain CCMP1545) TaxID=564608 RepID=C1N739_MICPC|nr:uncharacterized protein MICPUCDRAFT_43013 [Micromonas pusilla CCMP1545]EEH52208.1 predicted protein [Micromonas pusilla CCMP1545]|eukprot:XP_003063835.1 predicted protein [Micromonas pusilla CCMP1545]